MLNLDLEKKYFSNNHSVIGGIDEAGRGPLAGPVVAACVTIKADFDFELQKYKFIKDSKKLSASKREMLYEIIINNVFEYGIGICENTTIDKINILEATFLAMKKSIGSIKNKPEFLLIDGKFKIPNLSIAQEAIIKGDEKIFTIACASILAKVTRDNIMMEAHAKYPQYGFDKHMGYGTKLHIENIKKFGPCPLHRMSFEPIKSLSKNLK